MMDADEEFHFQRERLGSDERIREAAGRVRETIDELLDMERENIGRAFDEAILWGLLAPAPLEDGAFVITDAPLPPQRKEVL